VIIFYA